MQQKVIYLCLGVLIFSLVTPGKVEAAPQITQVSDNRSEYQNSKIPKYSKLEITFRISGSTAQNYYLPYDEMASSIAGLTPEKGISVDAFFLPPNQNNWDLAFRQPAFYFTVYDDQNKGGTPWYYPTDQVWKARFAPPECPNNNYPCTWQYRLQAQDSGGLATSGINTFDVIDSPSHGFIRVSARDTRYFEFSDGTYFPGLSINDIGTADKNSLANTQNFFTKLRDSGIQQLRLWLSAWTIFGSTWTSYWGPKNIYDGYLPRAGLITNRAESTDTTPSSVLTLVYSESGSSQNEGSWFEACRVTGAGNDTLQIPVKPNAKYRIRVRYQAKGISGPRNTSRSNYGFVAKINSSNSNCFNGGDGTPVTNYGHDTGGWTLNGGSLVSPQWSYLEGSWNSGSNSFFPGLTLALENVNNTTSQVNGISYNGHPYAYIDTVEIQEDKGNGLYGLNVVPQGSMSYLEHINDRNAYAFDKALSLAEQMGVYIRLVIMEKNEQVENEIGLNGLRSDFNNNNFYGSGRTKSALRWYQESWWRYLQARWGYSTAIHSWELVNEGDNGDPDHYAITDELGKFMHCRAFGISVGNGNGQKCSYDHPNDHPVSTSFWHSLMRNEFWNNSNYPNVDIADIHQYISRDGSTGTDPSHYLDSAKATYDISMWAGAKEESGSNKPIIRGETAFTNSGTDITSPDNILKDSKGIWLHNFVWGGINSGGLMESYWHYTQHIFTSARSLGHIFRHYYDFIKNVPLSNGTYQDAAATVTNSSIRAWGQKDSVGRLATHAHLWINNVNNTWYKLAVNGNSSERLTGTVTIPGFSPNRIFQIEWWNFDRDVTLTKSQNTVISDAGGKIILDLGLLPASIMDSAVKIGDYSETGQGTTMPGDTDNDGDVDFVDYNNVITDFFGTNLRSDFNKSGKVDIYDYNILVENY